jgi:hypothetical protein
VREMIEEVARRRREREGCLIRFLASVGIVSILILVVPLPSPFRPLLAAAAVKREREVIEFDDEGGENCD